MIITSTQIVQMCAKLAALSSNQASLTTQDFLDFANITVTTLVAEILGAREEYLIYQDRLPIIAGHPAVRIPPRSVNGEVRHLWFEDGTGSRTRLYALSIEDIENYSTNSTGPVTGFFVLGNDLIMLPTPDKDGTLVVAFPFRPNLLVDATTTRQVMTVGSKSVALPSIPNNFQSGMRYDIIDHRPGNGIVYYDLLGSISGNIVSFPTAIPNVIPGNHIAQAGQSPVPMLPEAAHPLVLETTVMRVEMCRGNAARVKNSAAIIQDARKSFDRLLNNRIVSRPHPAGSGGAQRPYRPF